jgi:hypothetical protein
MGRPRLAGIHLTGGRQVSTLTFLRKELLRHERKFRYLKESPQPKSAWQKTKVKVANLTAMLEREEQRLLDTSAKL